MKNNLERQKKFTCKIIFPDDLPLPNRRKFVRDAKKLGHHDGNTAKDNCVHLIFDSSKERVVMRAVANRIGYQIENTNHYGE
jgi:hypothetical protein